MKIDNKKILIAALLGGTVYLIWKNRKPAVITASEEPAGGGSGGVMGGGFPLIITPPAPAPAASTPTPVFKDMGSGATTVKCPTGYLYNPSTRACEPVKEDKPVSSGTTAKPPSGSTPTYGGSPTGPVGGGVIAPDPCGGVGVYDPITKSCKVSSTGGGVVGSIPFSGKTPLTIDNLLH